MPVIAGDTTDEVLQGGIGNDILIGAGGKKMKAVSSAARLDLERLFGGKVYLEVWVKVRAGWTENEAMIADLGYE